MSINWPEKIDNEAFSASCARVQSFAKSIFTWADDQTVWSEPDFWATPEELDAASVDGKITGDCDDYAALCLHALRSMEIEARYLLCWVETGGYHAACLARDGGAAWVLDNRWPEIMSRRELEKTGYEWHKMSSDRAGGTWSDVVRV